MDSLKFLDPADPATGFLSNFFRAPFVLDGLRWPTVEHYYQAQKFPGTPFAERIRQAATPREAKQFGRSNAPVLRADWDEVKQSILLRGLAAKFVQNPELIRRLLAARGYVLKQYFVEASAHDAYRGEGADGQGANHLGRLLTALADGLPACDHENMQALGGAGSLERRCLDAAWETYSSADWRPDWQPPGIHINGIWGPLYGQGIRELRDLLQAFLGSRLRGGWIDAPHGVLAPGAQGEAVWIGAAALRLAFADGSRLRLGAQTVLRMGRWPIQTLRAESVSDEGTPETWLDAASDALPHGELELVGLWGIPSAGWDELSHYYHQPACEALGLHFICPETEGNRETGWYLTLFGKRDEGTDAQARRTRTLPPSPYGTPWQRLACTEAGGALPAIQAAFAANFAHWHFELPLEDVVMRRAAEFDDGQDGIHGWNIRYRFGRDERGEYLDYDSYHRKCGESYDRVYADGTVVARGEEDAITDAELKPAAIPPETPPVPDGIAAGWQLKPGQANDWRGLLVVALILGVLGWLAFFGKVE